MTGTDPKVERATRKMLGHAIRHELDELKSVIQASGDKVFRDALDLCVYISAYIVIDVCERWPLDVDLHEIARRAALSATRLDIAEEKIYLFLSRVVLGSDKPDDAMPIELVVTAPLYVAANLLLSFCPRELEWWEYLDQIEGAAEIVERIPDGVLPALMLRVRKNEMRAEAQQQSPK